MIIGIISDTHDHIEHIRKAVKIFKEQKTEAVFHLGDYVAPLTIKEYHGLKIIGVFGNNDGDKAQLKKAFAEIGGEIHSDFHAVKMDGIKFALTHGKFPSIIDALASSGKYDAVLCGHTHKADVKKIGETLIINPGTCHGFGGKATIAIFDTDTRETKIIEI